MPIITHITGKSILIQENAENAIHVQRNNLENSLKKIRADRFKILFVLNNLWCDSGSRRSPSQLSRIEIESEECNCFSVNLLAVQNFILRKCQDTRALSFC